MPLRQQISAILPSICSPRGRAWSRKLYTGHFGYANTVYQKATPWHAMAEASSEPPYKKLKLESDAGESEEKSSSGARDKAQAFGSCDSKDVSCDSQGHKKIDSTHAKEEDVGITECVSPHPGFFAILKRRLGANTILPGQDRLHRRYYLRG